MFPPPRTATTSSLPWALRRSPSRSRNRRQTNYKAAALCWVSSTAAASSLILSSSPVEAFSTTPTSTFSPYSVSPRSSSAAAAASSLRSNSLRGGSLDPIDKYAASYSAPRSLYSRQHRFHRASSTFSTTTTAAAAAAAANNEGMSDDADADAPPHNKFRAALCQFLVGEDKQANLDTARRFIQEAAAAHQADLVVLPEIWNSPYATAAFPQYAEVAPDVGESYRDLDAKSQPSSHLLGSMARKHSLWLVGGSVPEIHNGNMGTPQYYNTCLVYNPDGVVVAKHRKVHLFDIDVPGKIRFMESDTLSPGQSITTFMSPWGVIGIGICYDIRFPEYSQILAQQCKARILVFPGAFNLTTGPLHWELLQRGRAVDNQCWVLTASPARAPPPPLDASSTNTSNKYPVYYAWGHSSAVNPWGTVVATCDENEAIVPVDVDLDDVRNIRGSIPIYEQRRSDLYTSAAPTQDMN
jgi:omega-amidase